MAAAQEPSSESSRFATLITQMNVLLDQTGAANLDKSGLDRLRSIANEALQIARKQEHPKNVALALHGLAVANQQSGDLAEAAVDYTGMLDICISLGNHAGANYVLRTRGWVYSLENRRDLAEADYRAAIIEGQKGAERHGELDAWNLLSGLLVDLGRFREALDAGGHAFTLAQQQHDLQEQAVALSHTGDAYLNLGDPNQALSVAEQQLKLGEQANLPQIQFGALGAESEAYTRMHKLTEALQALNRALALIPRDQGTRERAYALRQQCSISSQQAQEGTSSKEDSLSYCNKALASFVAVGDRANEADMREVIGFAYLSLGQHEKALEFFKNALPAAAGGGDLQLQSALFFYLMQEYRQSAPTLAIFFGKQSINLIQQIRFDNQALDRNLRTSFVKNKEENYRDLADLLITQGRYAEAVQVLDMLKQREFSEYIHANGTGNQVDLALALTRAERQAETSYEKASRSFATDAQRQTTLKGKKNPTPAETAEYRHLTDRASATPRVEEYLKDVGNILKNDSDANQELAHVTSTATELQREIALAPGTVGLYTLVMPDRYRVLVITASGITDGAVSISKQDLDGRIDRFRHALFDEKAKADVVTPAKDLYDILVRPVQKQLDGAHATTVVWSLDEHLRYVPVAALHDGQQYLVERYTMANVTPFSLKYLAGKPRPAHMRAVAMGLSGAYMFRGKETALPAVPSELRSVVRDRTSSHGAFPGTILLDSSFTKAGMDATLSGGQSVVHIASHFAPEPYSDNDSFLLLAGDQNQQADGFHFTVTAFREDAKIRLDHTELFTLSACGTADLEIEGDGREVDGIAATAHGKGARAVLSTLWSIHDVSTAPLMADFYKRWVAGDGGVTKAEALRQAQLDLLSGRTLPPKEEKQESGVDDFRHPVFWAPFVLTGNWK